MSHTLPITNNYTSLHTLDDPSIKQRFSSYDLLFTRYTTLFYLLRLVVSSGVCGVVNFIISYHTSEEVVYCMSDLSGSNKHSIIVSFFITSLLLTIVLSVVEYYLIYRSFRTFYLETPFYIHDAEESTSTGYYFLYPSLKVKNPIIRSLCFGLQALIYFSIPATVLLKVGTFTFKETDCYLDREDYSFLMSSYAIVHVICLNPVFCMSVLYNYFNNNDN